ncbi:MAG TPA: hypothetical protein VFM02_00095 [Candidatus Paceibacterota bacterium]|nr:hypothetical protein [Candidatus Paceibacterota bacterium]
MENFTPKFEKGSVRENIERGPELAVIETYQERLKGVMEKKGLEGIF